MSHKDFSQQFPSPPDNESVYHTPPEYLFSVFPNKNEPQNTRPTNLFPVFSNENQPQSKPVEVLFPILPTENELTNNPTVEYQPNPYGFTDEELLEKDLEVLREYQHAE